MRGATAEREIAVQLFGRHHNSRWIAAHERARLGWFEQDGSRKAKKALSWNKALMHRVDEEDRIRAAGLVLPQTGTPIEVEFLLGFLLFTYEKPKKIRTVELTCANHG